MELRQEGCVRGGIDEVVLRGIGRRRVHAGRCDVRWLRRHLLGVETGPSGVQDTFPAACFRRAAAGGCEAAATTANKPLAFLLR